MGCDFYEQEHFRVQGDSGYDYFCTRTGERVKTGTYVNIVPEDCPFMPMIIFKSESFLFRDFINLIKKIKGAFHGGS